MKESCDVRQCLLRNTAGWAQRHAAVLTPRQAGHTLAILIPFATLELLSAAAPSSSIYPWAYTGKFFFRLWLQNLFPCVVPRMVLRVMARDSIVLYMSKGAGHGFNCGVYV